MSDLPVRQAAVDFFHIWRHFQERNRIVGQLYSNPLSLLEYGVLIELSINPESSLRELSAELSIGELPTSRAATKLESRRLISKLRATFDNRERILKLTPLGSRTLAKIDREANDTLLRMNPSFPGRSLDRLVAVSNKLVAGLAVPVAKLRPVDHPLRSAIRTLTRHFGLSGYSAFGHNDISILELHILTAIGQQIDPITAIDLVRRFQAPTNTLSVILSRMERQGLVARKVRKFGDRREKELQLTGVGQKTLKQAESRSVEVLLPAVKRLSATEAADLLSLMALFTGYVREQRVFSLSLVVSSIDSSDNSTFGVYLADKLIAKLKKNSIRDILPEDLAIALTQINRAIR